MRYRAAGLSAGSLALRAGTAAVNAMLPVSVVPELGAGDLGIETTFLDDHGVVVGKVLVQGMVRGLFSTDATTMRRIGTQTAEYAARHLAAAASAAGEPVVDHDVDLQVIDLTPAEARRQLAQLEPLLGEWDIDYAIEVPGRPHRSSHAKETSRWEAGGRMFLQSLESSDGNQLLFRCNAVTWDPRQRRLMMFTLDSMFGMHGSHPVAVERTGNVLKAVASEGDLITELTYAFAADGRSMSGTKSVWTADRSQRLLHIGLEGRKR